MRLFPTTEGVRVDGIDPGFASTLVVTLGDQVEIAAGDGAYGYSSVGGTATLGDRRLHLLADGFFSIPGPAIITVGPSDKASGEGAGIVIAIRHGFSCLTLVGILERRGRLPYIDGCSDTLLISPPTMGDPCLNYLHMPAGTRQTMHRHPSVRIGVIVGGCGWCVTPTGRQALHAGLAFILDPGELHCFHTNAEAMHIVVYHPDSDFGPTPHDHPMINKTLIEQT